MRSGSHDKCILVHSPFLIMDKRDTFDPLLRLHCHSKPFSQHISDFMLVPSPPCHVLFHDGIEVLQWRQPPRRPRCTPNHSGPPPKAAPLTLTNAIGVAVIHMQ